MIVVIIAGGSGTRLWPLSTPAYPKHLLRVSGDDRSLLQHTYARAKYLGDTIYVISEAGHIHHVREQLPEIPEDRFIVEPARRGTASCILAALAQIASMHDRDEPIAFLAADHYIRDNDGFAYSFMTAAEVSKQESRIVLVGVEPDYPATGFGYIQKDDLLRHDKPIYNVDSFKEKPDHETAQTYLKSGHYLWNCGYFVGSINVFERVMQAYAPELFASYRTLVDANDATYETAYLALTTISIDYALIEKVTNLLVVPASFDWMDLGSYADMYNAVDHDNQGNHVVGNVDAEEVENSFIQNHEQKPLAVIGLDNIVVVNTPDGMIVARKDLSQKVGEVSKRLAAQK